LAMNNFIQQFLKVHALLNKILICDLTEIRMGVDDVELLQ